MRIPHSPRFRRILATVAALTVVSLHSFGQAPSTETPGTENDVILSPTPDQKARIDAFAKEIKTTKHYIKAEIAFRSAMDLGNLLLPTVIELDQDPTLSPEIRNVVLRHLLSFKHPLVYPEALKHIDSSNLEVCIRALNVVQKYGGKTARQVALKKIEHPDPVIRQTAVNMIIEHADPTLLYLFDKLKTSSDPQIRAGAVVLLQRINPNGFEEKYLEMVQDPDMQVYNIAALYLDKIRGEPDLQGILPYFSSPDPGNRLYALYRFQGRLLKQIKGKIDPSAAGDFVRLPDDFAARTAGPDPKLQAAVGKLLPDPVPQIRAAAIQAVREIQGNEFKFFFDRDLVNKLVQASDDPSAVVRDQAMEALYDESIKVGISLPMAAPQRQSVEVMQVLHWDTDDVVIPAYIRRLHDTDPALRKKAYRFLKFSTGQAFGLADFWDRDVPEITPEIERQWQDWWKAMSAKSVQKRTADAVDEIIRSLPAIEKDKKKLMGSIDALKIVTGLNYAWKPTLSPAEKASVIKGYQDWWAANRNRNRAQWIVDSLHASGIEKMRGETLHVLSRIANRSFGLDFFLPFSKKNAVLQLMEQVDKWLIEYKRQASITG